MKKKAEQANPRQMTEQERIENFAQDLAKARDTAYKEINIANEFGLGHQEIKHSAFLAHLFDPNRAQYCLRADKNGSRAYFLRFFFDALEKYAGGKGRNRLNSDILANGSGTGNEVTAADIENFGRAEDLQVNTETVGDGEDKKRIDILIFSEQKQTVFIIENKVFSTTHDDQLRRYEIRYQNPNWKKKVFVYLTPKGDIPQNEDETEAVNWCIFDYAALRDVVEEFKKAVDPDNGTESVTALKGDSKKRLIFALEDYMENINTEVLKKAGGEANDVYANLLDQYPDLVEGLVGFYNGARPLVIADHCREILKGKWTSNSRFWFYTEGMKEFFKRHGEEIDKKCYIVCQGKGGNKNAKSMEIWLELLISNGSPSPAQQLIMNDSQIKMLRKGSAPRGTQNYNIIPSQTFLKEQDMTASNGAYLPFEQVCSVIDQKLKPFRDLLTEFENILKTL